MIVVGEIRERFQRLGGDFLCYRTDDSAGPYLVSYLKRSDIEAGDNGEIATASFEGSVEITIA